MPDSALEAALEREYHTQDWYGRVLGIQPTTVRLWAARGLVRSRYLPNGRNRQIPMYCLRDVIAHDAKRRTKRGTAYNRARECLKAEFISGTVELQQPVTPLPADCLDIVVTTLGIDIGMDRPKGK